MPNGSTGKVATWGGSNLFIKYDVFRQNTEFFKGIELISFKLGWVTRVARALHSPSAAFIQVLEKCTKNLIGHSRLAFNNHESNIDC